MKLTIEVNPDDPRDVEAAERTLRRLRETPAPASRPREKQARGPALPKLPTPEEKADTEGALDAAAWDRYQARHGTRRTG